MIIIILIILIKDVYIKWKNCNSAVGPLFYRNNIQTGVTNMTNQRML